MSWISLPKPRRIQILSQVNNQTGIRAHAIEKDWWITVALKAVFSTPWAEHLVFKGGTSLTKSWNLIERFSEDIDLAIDKEFLGFTGQPNRSKIERLRRNASRFISTEFKEGIEQSLLTLGIPKDQFQIHAQYAADSIRDPQVLELQYVSVLEPDSNPYLKDKVLIEVGARSLREPSNPRQISSIIATAFPETSFSDSSFSVQTVDPKRTFLEKAFLLHELFLKGEGTRHHDRMSRHLYDLECLMQTPHADEALNDKELYNGIIEHRKAFNLVTSIDYNLHQPATINFIPPIEGRNEWENDYKAMQENMIYGKSPEFRDLMASLETLINRFREIS